jgi:hypothetical protein
LPATTTAAVKGIFGAVAMSALSIQSSSVAAVIASDDDGGGQRYIRSSSNVGLLSIQSSSVAAVIGAAR